MNSIWDSSYSNSIPFDNQNRMGWEFLFGLGCSSLTYCKFEYDFDGVFHSSSEKWKTVFVCRLIRKCNSCRHSEKLSFQLDDEELLKEDTCIYMDTMYVDCLLPESVILVVARQDLMDWMDLGLLYVDSYDILKWSVGKLYVDGF